MYIALSDDNSDVVVTQITTAVCGNIATVMSYR